MEPRISRTCQRLGSGTFSEWFSANSHTDGGAQPPGEMWALEGILSQIEGGFSQELHLSVCLFICLFVFWQMQTVKVIIGQSNLLSTCWVVLHNCVLSFKGHLCDIKATCGECRWKEEMKFMDWRFKYLSNFSTYNFYTGILTGSTDRSRITLKMAQTDTY